MANPTYTQEEINSFLSTLRTWSNSLPKKQQELLEHLIARSREGGGALSEKELGNVTGGLTYLGGMLAFRPRMGEWMQWSARQY